MQIIALHTSLTPCMVNNIPDNGINDFANNTGVTSPSDYQTDLTVEQLDRDDTILKTYILRNCQPTVVSPIELSYDTTNAIEEFTVTWRYTHFSTPSKKPTK